MTDTAKALSILKKNGPMTATQFGLVLWGTDERCLVAGKLLKQLREAGYTYWFKEGSKTKWKLTDEGVDFIIQEKRDEVVKTIADLV